MSKNNQRRDPDREAKSLGCPEIPDDPCHRCGYYFLSSDWVFALFGSVDPMTPACKLHDELYEYGPSLGLTQLEADNLFYEAMTAIANQYKWMKRAVLYAQRNTYYGIVRATGWAYWPGDE